MNALMAGAIGQRLGPQGSGWRSMDTAPRDGTVVELVCTYGVAPWYGLYRWAATEFSREPHWTQYGDEASSVSSESHLQWRPVADPDSYVDPTGGAQDDMAYWRGAVASKYALPLDHFEALAARNEAAANARAFEILEKPAPRFPQVARIMRTLGLSGHARK